MRWQDGLYRAVGCRMCAGLIARDGIVMESAPILRRYIGKEIRHVSEIWKPKYRRFRVEYVSEDPLK